MAIYKEEWGYGSLSDLWHKHEDLSLIPRTQVKPLGMVGHACNPGLGRWLWEDPWLAAVLIGKLHASERHILKEADGVHEGNTGRFPLASTGNSTHVSIQSNTNVHLHIYVHTRVKIKRRTKGGHRRMQRDLWSMRASTLRFFEYLKFKSLPSFPRA